MKDQLHIFFNAVMFYTRLPIPKWVNYNELYLNKATIYFPIMGWIIGLSSGITYILSLFFFSTEISILFSIASGILLTGAFHEDAFADVCDGFGGGWSKIKILEIMKDSRIGAYGVIGIIIMLALKFYCLVQLFSNFQSEGFLKPPYIILTLITSHSLSRFIAATFIYSHEYVRENEDSKAKPVAKKISLTEIFICGLIASLPLIIWIIIDKQFILPLVFTPLFLLKYFLGKYFNKWIGGYTGDCLGATQQLAEVVIYLFLIVLKKF